MSTSAESTPTIDMMFPDSLAVATGVGEREVDVHIGEKEYRPSLVDPIPTANRYEQRLRKSREISGSQ
jgi:hypothetical protein